MIRKQLAQLSIVGSALALAACAGGSPPELPPFVWDAKEEPESMEGARRVKLAIAAVGPVPDSLVWYHILSYRSDSTGATIELATAMRPTHAVKLEASGTGGRVRVWNGDSITVLSRYY